MVTTSNQMEWETENKTRYAMRKEFLFDISFFGFYFVSSVSDYYRIMGKIKRKSKCSKNKQKRRKTKMNKNYR